MHISAIFFTKISVRDLLPNRYFRAKKSEPLEVGVSKGSDFLYEKYFYLLENCGARLAFFKPYFFLSFILGSLVKNPAFLRIDLCSGSTSRRALAIPCLIAPA